MPATCPYSERTACGALAPGGGKPCPFERCDARRLLTAYDREFGRARQVLGDEIYVQHVRDMVVLQLRLDRISLRDNWLDLHCEEALADVDWFNAEVSRLHRYRVTVFNKWVMLRDNLREAAADPLLGWIDLYRVQYVLHGIGPACELATREVNLENVGTFDYRSESDAPDRRLRWPYSDDPDWRYR